MIAEDLAELPADRLAELLHQCIGELAERHQVDAANYINRALACLDAARGEAREDLARYLDQVDDEGRR